MTQIDKAIEYLKKAVEAEENVYPEEMLRDVFGIKRKLVSEYRWVSDKKEIKVGDMVKIIGPSIGSRIDMMGETAKVSGIEVTISGEKEFYTMNWQIFPESSVELV